MRAAVYYRVSTDDQNLEPQRLELVEYCQRRGWNDVREYTDKMSGAKFSRIGLELMMTAVRHRKIDVVAVVKLDRLGRSLVHLVQIISEMEAHGVALVATSQGIDTSADSPGGRLQMHVLAAVAEFERSLIRERTLAGLAAARAAGRVGGRRPVDLSGEQILEIEKWRQAGRPGGLRALAETLDVSLGTAHRLAKEASPKKASDTSD